MLSFAVVKLLFGMLAVIIYSSCDAEKQPRSTKFGLDILNSRYLRFAVPSRITTLFAVVSDRLTGKSKFRGILNDIVEHSSQVYNYSYRFSVNTEGIGIQLPNGSWNGAVGTMLRKEAEISVLGRSYGRNKVLEFARPFAYAQVSYWTSRSYKRSSTIAASYQQDVWMLILVSCFGVILVFYVLYDRAIKLERIFLLVFALLMDEAVPVPRIAQDKIRLMVTTWLLLILIISTGYKSQLMAALTHPGSHGYVPGSFEELASRPDYKVNFHHYNGAALAFFKANNSSPTVQTLRNRLAEGSISKCVTEALLLQRVACITWDTSAEPFIATNLTLTNPGIFYYKHTEPIYWVAISFGFELRSKYVQPFNYILGTYFERGLIAKWTQNFYLEERRDNLHILSQTHRHHKLLVEKGSKDMVVLSISHLEEIFVLYVGLSVASILVFLASWAHSFYLNSPRDISKDKESYKTKLSRWMKNFVSLRHSMQ